MHSPARSQTPLRRAAGSLVRVARRRSAHSVLPLCWARHVAGVSRWLFLPKTSTGLWLNLCRFNSAELASRAKAMLTAAD